MKLLFFCVLYFCLCNSVNGAVAANEDVVYVDPNTPICINVLSNDNYNIIANITMVSNGTAGGFGFLYNAYNPFFITSTSNMAVIEAENYQQINFRNFPSYSNYVDVNATSWETVSYNLYSTLQGTGGIRAWPNTGAYSGPNKAGPAARYNIAFRAPGGYWVNVRGQGCAQCSNGNCTGCTAVSGDEQLHFLTGEGASRFNSNGSPIKEWLSNTSTWNEFKVNWTISSADVAWPPKIRPIYLAMFEDGAVVDRFMVSLTSGSANGSAVGPAATQFVNCQSTDILYFPPSGFSGIDNVTYIINDGTGPSSAKVRVYVGVAPPSPSATPSQTPGSSPSPSPSTTPSRTSSPSPSISPGSSPSTTPSITPSLSPSPSPSSSPSVTPTSSVTATATPTASITPTTSVSPSSSSTTSPSSSPSPSPSATNSPTPSSSISAPHGSTKNNDTTTIIAGVVVAVAVCVGAVLLAAFLFTRKKNRAGHQEIELAVRPEDDHPSTTYISVAAESANYESFAKHDKHNSNNNRASDKVSVSDIKDSWDINFSEIKVIRKLGEGAFGEVWEGKWKGSHVAVKKLLTAGNDSEFLAEAELMKKMRPHPNVVLFIGICSDPLCLVTEYVANGDLLSFLQKGSVSNETKISITQGIAAGMYYLHQQGVIHRDLAARNILLDKLNNPKVSDFGMSRVAVQESGHKTATNFGPIRWMAPEALSERIYNVKTDVWSFGVVIYEILTCALPYHQIDLAQVAIQVAANRVSLLSDIPRDSNHHPKKLVEVMAFCLQYQPEDRPDFSKIVDMVE